MVADGLKKRFLLLPPGRRFRKSALYAGEEDKGQQSGSVQDFLVKMPEGRVGPHDGDQAAEGKLLADLGKL